MSMCWKLKRSLVRLVNACELGRVVTAAFVIVAFVAMPQLAHAQGNMQSAIIDTARPMQTSTAPAPGVDLVLDERVKAVASRLRCPVCQGESIQDSPAELASQMKKLVREQLAGGRTEAEVIEYFVGSYGQWIMLEPKAEGFNLFVYWLPVLFLLFGGIGIWVAVKRWTAPVAPAAPEAADAAPTVPPSA